MPSIRDKLGTVKTDKLTILDWHHDDQPIREQVR